MDYDYIIVGSGPAGSVLANKLSENNMNSVLLLEAGDNDDDNPLIKSSGSNLYTHTPEFFWHGQSVPQKNVNGRSFQITGGRTSGGGSSINGEMYVRPSPYVLKQWEKVGGEEWSPENAAKNFIEMEKYLGTNNQAHGLDGEMQIRQVFQDTPELIEKFISSIAEATGCKEINDYNDPKTPVGPFMRWQLYQKPNGERASASVCFLSGIVDKDGNGKNGRKLTVKYRSTAVKVLFNDKRETTGVEYVKDGTSAIANARRVILSAGIHSTQILMLSGIGPKDVLDAAGVPVIYENKNVGMNYAHDAYTNAVFKVDPKDIEEFMAKDKNGIFAGGAFLPNPLENEPDGKRCIQIIPSLGGPDALYLSILCIDPKSRGSLRIQNKDPMKIMLADFGFLDSEYDLDVLVATLKKYIGKTGDIVSSKDPAFRLVSPSPDVLADDSKLREYVRSTFIHTYHDQSQLRMGTEKDGVVNGYGEVHGVKGLTVADASIIPYHMDGNTSASAYLIGYTIAKHLLGKK